jgi:hypothetical protein
MIDVWCGGVWPQADLVKISGALDLVEGVDR